MPSAVFFYPKVTSQRTISLAPQHLPTAVRVGCCAADRACLITPPILAIAREKKGQNASIFLTFRAVRFGLNTPHSAITNLNNCNLTQIAAYMPFREPSLHYKV